MTEQPTNHEEYKLIDNDAASSEQPITKTVQTKSENVKILNNNKNDLLLTEEINNELQTMQLTEDVTCGFWFLKGTFLQKFANQTAYVLIYGLVGFIFSMASAYFNGTLTTMEKRFEIPSKNTGIISVGNDISQMLLCVVLSYYGGRGHRPHWIAFSIICSVACCLITAAPHFLYGPGMAALTYTTEYGAMPDKNSSMALLAMQRAKTLCQSKGSSVCSESTEGNVSAQVVLFVAQFISGIGGSLYSTLGIAYMDDNTKKSEVPALLTVSYFLRLLGPATGYALASFCLRLYIAPRLHPVFNNEDPRWLGAWWLGWLILGGLLFVSSILVYMFPRELPRTKARRIIEEVRRRGEELETTNKQEVESKASASDMFKTFKSLLVNKTLMCNNLAAVFYLFGYTPYMIFITKYIEIQYRQTAATSSMVTGTVALVFTAIGFLFAGLVVSKYKPSARYMGAWNVLAGLLMAAGMIGYSFIGCPGNENSIVVNTYDSTIPNAVPTCNSNCNCDYVRYDPICGENGLTYISPCHAGCKQVHTDVNSQKIYYDCACITNSEHSLIKNHFFERLSTNELRNAELSKHINETNLDSLIQKLFENSQNSTNDDSLLAGQAIPGACPVSCRPQFFTFLAIMCLLNFLGASGCTTNFFVAVRCVPEKDKTASMGLGMMMLSMFAFIPGPIFFGWLIDRLCLVWGETCTTKGNCWLYDPEEMRYTLNLTASFFITIGALFDLAVWYLVKDLKIFDEESSIEAGGEVLQMENVPLTNVDNVAEQT